MSNSIYIQASASRSRGIAADIPATGMDSREIAADIQEMVANIGEIGIYSRRTAARSRGMAANSLFSSISA